MSIYPHLAVKLPSHLGMTSISDFTSELQHIVTCCQNNQRFELLVDMSDVRFIRPTGLAAISALLTYLVRNERLSGGTIVPPNNANVHGYLERMDFYNFLDIPITTWTNRRSSAGRFREVVEIDSESMVSQVATELVDVLQGNVAMSQQAVNSLQIALAEMIDNVFHHAQSPVNAIVCAQSYPLQRKVELSIVDCGRGFYQSLSDNPIWREQLDSSLDALQLAIQHKVTGKPENNTGIGLFYITELVRQNGGDLLIYSDDGELIITKGQMSLRQRTIWPGAIVSLRLSLDNHINISELFDQHDPMDEDDFFEIST